MQQRNACNTEFRYYNKSWKWCNDLILIDFVSKAFAIIIEKYFILYNDVYAIIPECLSRILGQTWEELRDCTSHKSRPFLHLRREAKPTVSIIKPTRFWTALGYYKLPLLVYKATLPIFLTWGPYNRLLTRNFNLVPSSTITIKIHTV